MSRWRMYNPNPAGRMVGDCAVRAVSAALDVDWETAYRMIADAGLRMNDMPSSDSVWGSILRSAGYYRQAIPNDCPDCYTVEQFARENPEGTFILGTGQHAVAVIDGEVWDSWDSRREIPVFVWYRKEYER